MQDLDIMPPKDSPRTEPQSRRDRWESGDPRSNPEDTTTPHRDPADPEAVASPDGQSGYGAGDGQLQGAGAWSGRATRTSSNGTGPVPTEGVRTANAETSAKPPTKRAASRAKNKKPARSR